MVYVGEPGPMELSTDTERHSVFGSEQSHAEREVIFQAPFLRMGKGSDYLQTESLRVPRLL